MHYYLCLNDNVMSYMAIFSSIVFFLFSHGLDDGWGILGKVKFTTKFYKEHNEYFLTPFLDSRIRFYEGKEFTLKGHYLPMDLEDKNTIIVSKYPYSACFFCGGAGPESVAEVHFKDKAPRFRADQVVTVKGILKLNEKDIKHMNFILTDAVAVAN
jgi:hypothetical protein